MNTETRMKLTVLSWNVNGFTQKKMDILNHLNLLKADVVFLQETHIGSSTNCPAGNIQIQNVEHDYDWAVYTVFKRNCRGVAVLFRRNLGFEGLRAVADENGRHLVISCRIQGQDFVFVNVYNPTDEKIDFNKFRDSLVTASESTYFLLGGDFNTVMDAEVDKTSNNQNRGHRQRFKDLVHFLESFDLVDVWRWLYPEEKSFTYFDEKGKSRLDYFFLPIRILTSVTACKIHSRPQYSDKDICISDHAPVSVQIQTGGRRWQFDSGFFSNADIMEGLTNMIKTMSGAKQNRKGDLWPAFKVRVTCETLMFYKSGDEFRSPRHLTAIQTSQIHTEKQLMDQQVLLASARHKHILHSPDVGMLSEATNIEEYLDYLYEKEMLEDIRVTLNSTLTEPISKKEILSAILSLHNSEHLTPDGLPVSFYKHFASKLTDLLQAFFNEVLDLQSIHSIKCVFNEYFISETTSMTSDNTDHTYCSYVQCYSPVSVFNVDYNILALILAERLNSIMGYVLNPGKSRSHLSLRDCIDVFEKSRVDQLPVLVFSIKVDPGAVKWPYLFQRLKTLKLPNSFKSVLRFLLLAKGKTINQNCTTHVPPSRGLKVGCPLTPLLISMCLLPLIHTVNSEEKLQGIRTGGQHIKSVLDKDKAIIFLSNTNEGFHAFGHLLEDFITNSGFVIDSRFSEVFITGHAGISLNNEMFQLFKINPKGFWYKGVLVGSDDAGLVQVTGHQCQYH